MQTNNTQHYCPGKSMTYRFITNKNIFNDKCNSIPKKIQHNRVPRIKPKDFVTLIIGM